MTNFDKHLKAEKLHNYFWNKYMATNNIENLEICIRCGNLSILYFDRFVKELKL